MLEISQTYVECTADPLSFCFGCIGLEFRLQCCSRVGVLSKVPRPGPTCMDAISFSREPCTCTTPTPCCSEEKEAKIAAIQQVGCSCKVGRGCGSMWQLAFVHLLCAVERRGFRRHRGSLIKTRPQIPTTQAEKVSQNPQDKISRQQM